MNLEILLLRSRFPGILAKLIFNIHKQKNTVELLEMNKYLYLTQIATVPATTKAVTTAATTTVSKYCSNFPYDLVQPSMTADEEQRMINLFCSTTKGMLFEFALISMLIKVCWWFSNIST